MFRRQINKKAVDLTVQGQRRGDDTRGEKDKERMDYREQMENKEEKTSVAEPCPYTARIPVRLQRSRLLDVFPGCRRAANESCREGRRQRRRSFILFFW